MAGLVAPAKAERCAELLDRYIYATLRSDVSAIPDDSITSMTEDYSEMLPKVYRFKTSWLSKKTSKAYRAATKIGLIEMLRSQTLLEVAQELTGLRLVWPPSVQIICYSCGDYVGPHNDHHPERDPELCGYVDFHVMFSNAAVKHQYLIYQNGNHLSTLVDVNVNGGISVYRLPFWHQVTPLVAKPGSENIARRWLLLATFDIARD